MKIVLDSDVIIAGLISDKGASNFILEDLLGKSNLSIYTSSQQIKEINKVLKRKELRWKEQKKLWKKFQKETGKKKIGDLKSLYPYVLDKNDAHILAVAVISKASFLLTYNLKDYFTERIKEDFEIFVVNPGYFIQFYRELNPF